MYAPSFRAFIWPTPWANIVSVNTNLHRLPNGKTLPSFFNSAITSAAILPRALHGRLDDDALVDNNIRQLVGAGVEQSGIVVCP